MYLFGPLYDDYIRVKCGINITICPSEHQIRLKKSFEDM